MTLFVPSLFCFFQDLPQFFVQIKSAVYVLVFYLPESFECSLFDHGALTSSKGFKAMYFSLLSLYILLLNLRAFALILRRDL